MAVTQTSRVLSNLLRTSVFCRTNATVCKRTFHNTKLINVVVEGNIGSGKTTLLEHFAKFPEVQVSQEPLDQWRDIKGHNLLSLMYEDPKRWSLTFQTFVQLTMVVMRTEKQLKAIRMMERSIYSAKYCFVENQYRSGFMPDSEYVVLTEWFNWLIQNLDLKMDLIVYLRTDPENCLRRIQERSRSEETGITTEFLQVLHKLHEDWLVNKVFPVPAPVLILDGNNSIEDMKRLFAQQKDKILCQNTSDLNGTVQVDVKWPKDVVTDDVKC
ncbi:thymidine kinase 2, mitochondrial-like [Glandiceps talaboti]